MLDSNTILELQSVANTIDYNNPSNFSNFINILKPKKTKPAKIIWTPEQKEHILKAIHSDCPICIEEMTKAKQMYITKCNHIYHKACWKKYPNKHECPMCRTQLK